MAPRRAQQAAGITPESQPGAPAPANNNAAENATNTAATNRNEQEDATNTGTLTPAILTEEQLDTII